MVINKLKEREKEKSRRELKRNCSGISHFLGIGLIARVDFDETKTHCDTVDRLHPIFGTSPMIDLLRELILL